MQPLTWRDGLDLLAAGIGIYLGNRATKPCRDLKERVWKRQVADIERLLLAIGERRARSRERAARIRRRMAVAPRGRVDERPAP